MRTFGFALAAVLCAVQLTVALPRPDFGIDIEVFSSARTNDVAVSVTTLLEELWNDDPITLTSGYDTLTDVVDEINTIGADFVQLVEALFDAISDLANADSDVTSSFGAVKTAISSLKSYFTQEVSANYENLANSLENNEITTMLEDAFDEMSSTLSDLGSALDALKTDIDSVVLAAGNDPITKTLLRNKLMPSKTTKVTIQVESLKADLPLVFYILMTTKDLVKMADDYIIEIGVVAASAVEYIEAGLQALVDEVDSYSQATSDVQDIVDNVSELNLDFTGLDLTVIPDIQTEIASFSDVYVDYFQETISSITGSYSEYKTAIPTVSVGYSAFYSDNACDHIYDIVTVLINFGPYAEYCFEKYRDHGLALFTQNARQANECVDREITRLLKLQEVLVSIAEVMVFSIEDLLQTVTVCLANTEYCNGSQISSYLNALQTTIDDYHLYDLEDIVDYETDAGLARLRACFTASKYGMFAKISELQNDIYDCETNGPIDP